MKSNKDEMDYKTLKSKFYLVYWLIVNMMIDIYNTWKQFYSVL